MKNKMTLADVLDQLQILEYIAFNTPRGLSPREREMVREFEELERQLRQQ